MPSSYRVLSVCSFTSLQDSNCMYFPKCQFIILTVPNKAAHEQGSEQCVGDAAHAAAAESSRFVHIFLIVIEK